MRDQNDQTRDNLKGIHPSHRNKFARRQTYEKTVLIGFSTEDDDDDEGLHESPLAGRGLSSFIPQITRQAVHETLEAVGITIKPGMTYALPPGKSGCRIRVVPNEPKELRSEYLVRSSRRLEILFDTHVCVRH